MAQQKQNSKSKTQEKKGTSGLELSYSENIAVNDTQYTITVQATVTDKQGKLVKNSSVTFYDANLVKIDTVRTKKGKALLIYEVESGPGKTVIITAEAMVEDSLKTKKITIMMPLSPQQQAANIKLRVSRSWFEFKWKHNKFNLLVVARFYAVVTDKDGNAVEGVEVEFHDDYPDTIYKAAKTNSYGRVAYDYARNSKDSFGKKKEVFARIKGTSKMDSLVIKLDPDLSCLRYTVEDKFESIDISKTWKAVAQAWFNWDEKKKLILRHATKTLLFFLPALLIMTNNFPITYRGITFNAEVVSTLYGIVAGAYFCRKLSEKRSQRFIIWGIFALAGFLLSFISAQVTIIALWCILLFEIFYPIEELTYYGKEVTENGKTSIKWTKLSNFYPWAGLGIIGLLLGLSLIALIGYFILLFSGKLNGFPASFPIYSAIDNFNRSNLLDYLPQQLEALKVIIASILGLSTGFFGLFIYAAPGEFIDMVKGKAPEASAGKLIERIFFIKEMTDLIRRKR